MFVSYAKLPIWARTGVAASFGIANGFVLSRCLIRFQSRNTMIARNNREKIRI